MPRRRPSHMPESRLLTDRGMEKPGASGIFRGARRGALPVFAEIQRYGFRSCRRHRRTLCPLRHLRFAVRWPCW